MPKPGRNGNDAQFRLVDAPNKASMNIQIRLLLNFRRRYEVDMLKQLTEVISIFDLKHEAKLNIIAMPLRQL
jgi:hypothetical protein